MALVDSLTEEEILSFGKRLLAEAIDARGFGIISKAEIEALMFNELMKTSSFRGKSNYKLASELKVPERKVKALLLQDGMRFRHLDHKVYIKHALQRGLDLNTIQSVDDRIHWAIENPAELREVVHALKECGETPDSGRNREILIFSARALLVLIACHLQDEEKKFAKWMKKEASDKRAIQQILDNDMSIKDKIVAAVRSQVAPEFLKASIREGARLAFKATLLTD